jgi:hypothetical protein
VGSGDDLRGCNADATIRGFDVSAVFKDRAEHVPNESKVRRLFEFVDPI